MPVKLAIEEIFSEYMLQGGHNKTEETDNGMPIKLIIAGNNKLTAHVFVCANMWNNYVAFCKYCYTSPFDFLSGKSINRAKYHLIKHVLFSNTSLLHNNTKYIHSYLNSNF